MLFQQKICFFAPKTAHSVHKKHNQIKNPANIAASPIRKAGFFRIIAAHSLPRGAEGSFPNLSSPIISAAIIATSPAGNINVEIVEITPVNVFSAGE